MHIRNYVCVCVWVAWTHSCFGVGVVGVWGVLGACGLLAQTIVSVD